MNLESCRARLFLLTLTIVAACLVGLAQQPPPSQSPPSQQPPTQQPPPPSTPPPADPTQVPQQPTFRAGVNFVRVDVIVTDGKGNPVTDLRQEDFEITEDNRAQKIETFRLVNLGSAAEARPDAARPIRTQHDEETEAARDDVRLFAIFLDEYHVRRASSMGVREPLQNFITKQLAASDLLGIMYPLTPVSEVRFTRNHEGIARNVQTFLGRKYDYRPMNDFEERYAYYPAAMVERVRNQVVFSALKALAIHLGGVREGRKAIILVTEGFTNSLPPQLSDPVAAMPGLGNPNRGRPTPLDDDPRRDSQRFFNEVDILSELREVYDTANRYNCAIYTLDPRGLAPFEYDINEGVNLKTDSVTLNSTMDTLRILANETDGRAIVNRNDLEVGLRQITKDLTSYYLIGYSSTPAPQDGKFHQIKVRVKRPGVQVRTRKGYWALSAEETARATAPPKPGPPAAVDHALAVLAEPSRGRSFRTWIGTSRGEGGKTRVTLVWEPVPAPPGVRQTTVTRVSLVAAAGPGQVYFRGPIPAIALASGQSPPTAVTTSPASSPAGPARVSFEVNPGKLELRIAAEGSAGETLDTTTREIVVPDLTAPQIALGTPAVLRARNAVEFRTINGDPDAVPIVGREFRRTDRLLVRFHAYGPGESGAEATARLLNRAGTPMSELQVNKGSAPGTSQQVDLPLASLPNGEYLIEIKATGPAGEAKELIAFRVVS